MIIKIIIWSADVAETANIAEVAKKIANDIFRVFFWELRQREDTNFDCALEAHKTPKGDPKKTHPCDVLFHYFDPYLNKTIYLHTDLKSYSKTSLKQGKIRDALNSLAMTIECAALSADWRKKYPKTDEEIYEVRGLLFVANHDNKAPTSFNEHLSKISRNNISLARNQVMHVLGPKQISDLYSIATDIKLSIADNQLSPAYRFFYPDLTLWKRKFADDVRTAATIETLLSPYFILRHSGLKDNEGQVTLTQGSLIYYSRKGETVEEFVYLLDSLLRYQLVGAKEVVRIRMFKRDRSPDFKSNFDKAKHSYCRTWGFDESREQEIMHISIDAIAKIEPNYVPDEIGWKDN
jgi:hypothetical protein